MQLQYIEIPCFGISPVKICHLNEWNYKQIVARLLGNYTKIMNTWLTVAIVRKYFLGNLSHWAIDDRKSSIENMTFLIFLEKKIMIGHKQKIIFYKFATGSWIMHNYLIKTKICIYIGPHCFLWREESSSEMIYPLISCHFKFGII